MIVIGSYFSALSAPALSELQVDSPPAFFVVASIMAPKRLARAKSQVFEAPPPATAIAASSAGGDATFELFEDNSPPS